MDSDLLKSQRKIDLLKKAKKEAEKQNNQMFGKKILTNIVDKLVISVPEVKIFPIAESDGLLLIATDGVLFFSFSNRQRCPHVSRFGIISHTPKLRRCYRNISRQVSVSMRLLKRSANIAGRRDLG